MGLSLGVQVAAQELSALARVDVQASGVTEGWFGRTDLTLALSQGVPFRVFTLDDPARLVVDFREVDFSGVQARDILGTGEGAGAGGQITGLRFGAFRPGWSRLVADLGAPLIPREIGMPVDENSGRAVLQITLDAVDAAAFAAQAGAPDDPAWMPEFLPEFLAPELPEAATGEAQFVVVLDPGHGGVDPGAEREGVNEKELMLSFARTLAEALRRRGVAVLLTRQEDVFVDLESRVAIAQQANADLFISLHADSLEQGGARGATVYTLAEEASDKATEQLVARHDRSDIIAGIDLTGADDQVAQILLDYARRETGPRATALAQALVEGMAARGGPMNRHPMREAGFSVLKSADIPSVLIEIGFLSSPRDLTNLRDPVWRQGMAEGIAEGVLQWRDADAARQGLVRK